MDTAQAAHCWQEHFLRNLLGNVRKLEENHMMSFKEILGPRWEGGVWNWRTIVPSLLSPIMSQLNLFYTLTFLLSIIYFNIILSHKRMSLKRPFLCMSSISFKNIFQIQFNSINDMNLEIVVSKPRTIRRKCHLVNQGISERCVVLNTSPKSQAFEVSHNPYQPGCGKSLCAVFDLLNESKDNIRCR